jgi:hypothetical protein
METIITEIGGNPFEITLNAAYMNEMPLAGFDCLWTVGLKFHHLEEDDTPTASEREEMLSLSNLVISMLRLAADISLVGITVYQQTQEILFYTAKSDVEEIGATINGFGETIGEPYTSRLLGVEAVEDPSWNNVAGYFELLQAAREENATLN